MRITPYIAAFLVTLGLVVPTHAFADALGEPNAALNREHYETALQLLRPLAKNGDAAAQYEIGSIYPDRNLQDERRRSPSLAC
jgi:ABC-type hemin transport system ATPase subunit